MNDTCAALVVGLGSLLGACTTTVTDEADLTDVGVGTVQQPLLMPTFETVMHTESDGIANVECPGSSPWLMGGGMGSTPGIGSELST